MRIRQIHEEAKELRERLIKQAGDAIDTGDYRQQILAYQRILLKIIDMIIELTTLQVETGPGSSGDVG